MAGLSYRKQALRALARAPANVRARIRAKIALLAENPAALAGNIKKLQGREGYRLRVGDWRVIYEWRDGMPVILVILDIGPRGGIYEQE